MSYSHNEIVNEVIKWFAESDIEDQIEFVSADMDDLIVYHSGLGRTIRNTFDMWQDEWEPEYVNGSDHSPHHPDARSMQVLVDAWRRLNASHQA
jgi:hypothetical protein